MEASTEIQTYRQASGLSIRALAKRAQTSPATLSRYERGMIMPRPGTLARILDAAIIPRRRWSSLERLAAAIHEALEAEDEVWAWKCVGEVLDDEAACGPEMTAWFVAKAPQRTGDMRADALAAAVAEYLCVLRSIPSPTWLHDPRICRPFWFLVGGLPGYEEVALAESPASFAARGIFVTRADLDRA